MVKVSFTENTESWEMKNDIYQKIHINGVMSYAVATSVLN